MTGLYLLAILPPAQLSEQIDNIRKECAAKFGVKAALKPPVHITLYRLFKLENSFEKQFIRLFKALGHTLQPFEQQLENFDSFNTHTVYIRAVKNPEIMQLNRSVSAVFSKYKIDPQETKSNLSFTPHITIAYRDISPEVFPEIWQEYKDRKFKREFLIDRITLLKHDTKRWNKMEEFRLQCVHQPTLFG